jgi:hypothetical protein
VSKASPLIDMVTWNAYILVDPTTKKFLPLSKLGISSRELTLEGTPEVFTTKRSAAATGRQWTRGQFSRVSSYGEVSLVAKDKARPKLTVTMVILTSWLYDMRKVSLDNA